ncbi:hypothetical protein NLI96_g12742 [Meripilus lineatus]|uniref:Uncharacterized protein n=1 Tax=Meripilus lineatus TaxID=2056292 RepID=A0AAD5Y9L2_9APHY|nr:hypothetical protein NLI96_g12742 [Physisporinus lineatus]
MFLEVPSHPSGLNKKRPMIPPTRSTQFGLQPTNPLRLRESCPDLLTSITPPREEENFIFPITIHPDVSGIPETVFGFGDLEPFRRPHVIMMLERFIEWVNTHEGVHWVPMIEMANEFRARCSPPLGAVMPRGFVPEEGGKAEP